MMSDLRDNFSAVTERINNILVAHSEFKIAGCFFFAPSSSVTAETFFMGNEPTTPSAQPDTAKEG